MTAHRSTLRRAAAAAAAVTAAAVLAGCGSDAASDGHSGHGKNPAPGVSAPASTGTHNAADVSFAQGMIPHHRQAVEMADLAATRASSQEVKDLAAAIRKAQAPEIKTLTGWLASWGEEVPAGNDGTDHSGHGTYGMEGMMSPKEMEELERASGKDFDTAFLTMMIKHHEGAVTMAEAERKNGSHALAKSMAGDIIATQSSEIEEMNRLLDQR
ncbi:DUF305 domain-containing protein [Streptomyces sp. TRM43335]|uniref:DUF305 domain-containing protein n=1 Tax=Streptomyces taklimakanensis TaxID=2569853 RepID=A0A6G2BIN8_9ACTN|nr:DUF305 domain-containing protein [Streptomyces taklimakanensis]MTE22110.1 DUF305 domain-containing protein [Streptomyces taklimakanensis]